MEAPTGIRDSDQSQAPRWQPHLEPLIVTVARNGLIAVVVGLVVARLLLEPAAWPRWALFVLWFTFGGHWMELFFLNRLRPRLPSTRGRQVIGRIFIWVIGGTLLLIGARTTVVLLGWQTMRLPPWWLGGIYLIALELVAHALLALRGRPNFYNGLG